MNTIKIHNDGKEKWNSFEAWTDFAWLPCRGYGDTQEQAIKKYIMQLRDVRNLLDGEIRELSSDLVSVIKVDYWGKEISSAGNPPDLRSFRVGLQPGGKGENPDSAETPHTP